MGAGFRRLNAIIVLMYELTFLDLFQFRIKRIWHLTLINDHPHCFSYLV